MTLDFNVDAGEGGPHDAALIALADSVNIACGGHAGSPDLMRQTLELAEGKNVGAHPGYEDRENFGRHPLDLAPGKLSTSVAHQIEALAQLSSLHHVKPHGALYHQAQGNEALAQAILDGISKVLPITKIFTLPGGSLAQLAAEAGHEVVGEGFLDRGYLPNGQLIPRGQPGDLITNPAQALLQARGLIARSDIKTLCVHSDSPEALKLLQTIRREFKR